MTTTTDAGPYQPVVRPVDCPTVPPARTLSGPGIWAVPAAGGSAELAFAEPPGPIWGLGVTADVSALAYVAPVPGSQGQGGTLSIAERHGANRTEVTGVRLPGLPSWSPDGQWLAFTDRPDGGASGIWIVDRHGDNRRFVTPAPSGIGHLVWSPNGRRIAWGIQGLEQYGATPGAFVAEVETGAEKRVATDSTYSVDWAPDSRSLAISTTTYDTTADHRPHRTGAFAIGVDTAERVSLQPDGLGAWWSPDGDTVVVNTTSGPAVVAGTGGDERSLGSDDAAGWSSDGRFVVTGAGVTTLDGCRGAVVAGVDPGHLNYVGWSPDGATIAYHVLPA
jgi:dipeptidyl aminopeptidase/acylaminoacyl peptidase